MLPVANLAVRQLASVVSLGLDNGLLWSRCTVRYFLGSLLRDWVASLAGTVINVGNLAISGASALLQVGLIAFLKAAGVDPQIFQQTWEMLQAHMTDAAQTLGDIAKDPLGYAATLIEGGQEGVAEFFSNILDELKKAFAWLFGNLEQLDGGKQLLDKPPTDLPGVILFLLGQLACPPRWMPCCRNWGFPRQSLTRPR